MFSAQWFFNLEKQLRDNGLDSDNQSFDEILENLQNRKIYPPDEFAYHCMYVILAGGFSQKTAKKIHQNIIPVQPLKHKEMEGFFPATRKKSRITFLK